jgi:RNA polymerase sigma factor (TIGR02999 family)
MLEPGEVTKLLSQVRLGEDRASEQLVPIVYDELRRIARHLMRNEAPGHTLQPTAVVHEAYLRLFRGTTPTLENRAHFFAIAARIMRQILIDHARRKIASKRSGEACAQLIEENIFVLTEAQSEEILSLHEAMGQLQELDSRQAQVVEMHYFAGNTVEEIAAALHLSDRTVKRELKTARLFLKKQLHEKGLQFCSEASSK